jgi:hypothetical protein
MNVLKFRSFIIYTLVLYFSSFFHNGIFNCIANVCKCMHAHVCSNFRRVFLKCMHQLLIMENVIRGHASTWLVMTVHNFSVWDQNNFTLVQGLIFKWTMPLLRWRQNRLFSAYLLSFPLTLPLFHTHLSLSAEVCDSSDKVPHYHTHSYFGPLGN